MINKDKFLTKNAQKYLIADFFWNLGRTLPHAILTVYLLSVGTSLTQVALLQSVFMVVAMITEFPSGVIADYVSRKSIYIVSIITILLAYVLIGFFSSDFPVLLIAYILYGLSVALKSGTLEADVVLEFRKNNMEIKHFSVMLSYTMSASSLIGGLLGSILYSYFVNRIYIVSIIFFALSIMFGSVCFFEKEHVERREAHVSIGKEVKNAISLLKENVELPVLIILFALTALFVQPFFQYWQVLYQECQVPVAYFGIIYIAFQLCNILASYTYKRLKNTAMVYHVILLSIPAFLVIGILMKQLIIVLFRLWYFCFISTISILM